MANKLIVEVAYATPEEQILLTTTCPPGSSVQYALENSGLLERFPDLLTNHTFGIWSKNCTLDQLIQSGDRIEIYRPLLMSPMEARLKRAKKTATPKTQA